MIYAAILAGGRGTRLAATVSDRPKVLANVSGRPFLEFILLQLAESGFKNVVLCTGYLANQIRNHFGSVWNGVIIHHSEETQPLGTAGALRLALPLFKSERIVVLNGDSLYRGHLLSSTLGS